MELARKRSGRIRSDCVFAALVCLFALGLFCVEKRLDETMGRYLLLFVCWEAGKCERQCTMGSALRSCAELRALVSDTKHNAQRGKREKKWVSRFGHGYILLHTRGKLSRSKTKNHT